MNKIKNTCVFLILALIIVLSAIFSINSYLVKAETQNYYGISIDQQANVNYISYEEYHSYDNSNIQNSAWFPNTITEAKDTSTEESADQNLIFGSDDRITLSDSQYTNYPYSSICRISTSFDTDDDGIANVTYFGTGVLVGPNTVLSCSHLMYNSSYGWPLKITVAPGAHTDENGNYVTPYGSFTSWSTLHVGVYFNTGNTNDDWSLLDLTDDIGNTTGYYGTSYNSISVGSTVRLYGYHGDLYGKLAYGLGTVTMLSTYKFYHNCDAIAGSSGGPLTVGTNVVVGIHSGGVDDTQDCACKVSSYIVGWVNERL